MDMGKTINFNQRISDAEGIANPKAQLSMGEKALVVSVYLFKIQTPDKLMENMNNVRFFLGVTEKGITESNRGEWMSMREEMCMAFASVKEPTLSTAPDDIKKYMNEIHAFLTGEDTPSEVPVGIRGRK
jgi:hypothetical protein